jgi:hypothetical protein
MWGVYHARAFTVSSARLAVPLTLLALADEVID